MLDEVRGLQNRAVMLYNQGDLPQAADKFEEVLQVLLMLYAENHPEVLRAQKSIAMVQKKIQAEAHKPPQGR